MSRLPWAEQSAVRPVRSFDLLIDLSEPCKVSLPMERSLGRRARRFENSLPRSGRH